VERDGIHHGRGQQRRRRAREHPDGDAEGADDLEGRREIGPEQRWSGQEGEVDGDNAVGEGRGVLELVETMMDDEQRGGDTYEQHAQLSPTPLEAL